MWWYNAYLKVNHRICTALIVWLYILFNPTVGFSNHQACNAPLFTVTDSITQTSFRLNWTDFNDQVSGWELEWGLQGFERTNNPNSELITSPSYILSDLQAGTSYDIYIRARCSDEESSSWNGPFKVNTAINNSSGCDLTLDLRDNNCPRLEDFFIDVDGIDGNLGTDVFIQSVDLIIEHDWPADLQLSLVSPSGKRILLSRNRGIGLDNYGNPQDSLCVEVCSFSDFACTSISELGSQQLIGSFLPEEKLSDLYDNTPVDGLWKLSMCDRALEDRGIIKYIQINFAPVICNVPTEIVATDISDSSAVIRWNPPDNCRVAIINVVLSGETPGSNIEIFTSCQSSEFNVTGLLPETGYDIYIRSDCNTAKSAFSCPASFVTACNFVTLSTSFEDEENCVESCNATCGITGLWKNIQDDEQDWLVHSGSTATENTGPEGDISGVGNYIYIENTLDLCGASNKAILETTCIDIVDNPGPCDMSFYYHMYGEHIDSLQLLISTDDGASWIKIFEAYGDGGKVWNRAFIDLSEYKDSLGTFRFVGISGVDDRADIALDQIEFYGSNIQSPLPIFYFDKDGDGYGGMDSIVSICVNNPPPGFTREALDCNDGSSTINPGSPEIQCNLVDENCNGNADDAAETNPILYDIVMIKDESCPGAGDATIEIEVNGGNPPYDIMWNNGNSGSVVSNLKEDVYFATITDAGTCTIVTEFIDIDVESIPQIFFIESKASRCNDSTGLIDIEIAGGQAPYTYNWNNGMVTQDLLNIPEGIYSVTATDDNGCEVIMENIRIESSPRFTAGIQSQKDLSCFGDSNGIISIGIFNAVDPISYKWSNGDTTSITSNLKSGSYTVTINDARGCEEIITAEIISPEKLESDVIAIEQVTCFNGSSGSINVGTRGGTFPYNFQWTSDPELSFTKSRQEDIDNLVPGFYQLMVSDGKGCIDTTRNVVLSNPSQIQISTDSVNNVRCKLSNNGYLSVGVEGGAGEYSYFWGVQTPNVPFIDSIPSGIYSLTVIDKFGCKRTTNDLSVTNQNTPLIINAEVITDNKCSYDSIGEIKAVVSDGIAPFDFNWSSGRQSIIQDNVDTVLRLQGGNYNVTVTDSEGCVGTSSSLSINSPEEVVLDKIMLTLNECNSDLNGEILLDVSGGQRPYQYLWSNGEVTKDLNQLPNGDYRLTITDSNNCNFQFETIRMSSIDPIISGAQVEMVSGGMDNGSITLDISGGDPPYNIDWDSLADEISQHSNLTAGTYCVTITDKKGCFLAECYSVDQSDSNSEITLDWLELYPNPANRTIIIRSERTIDAVTILSLDGRNNKHIIGPSHSYQLDIGHLVNGLHIVKLQIGDKVYFRKILKIN